MHSSTDALIFCEASGLKLLLKGVPLFQAPFGQCFKTGGPDSVFLGRSLAKAK